MPPLACGCLLFGYCHSRSALVSNQPNRWAAIRQIATQTTVSLASGSFFRESLRIFHRAVMRRVAGAERHPGARGRLEVKRDVAIGGQLRGCLKLILWHLAYGAW